MSDHTTSTKVCTKCGEEKLATTEFFSRCVRSRDGFQYRCKECARAYAVENRVRRTEYQRAWAQANPERVAKYNHTWYITHKSEKAERDRARYAKTKEKQLAANRAWRKANLDRRREYDRARRQANPEIVRAKNQLRRARILGADGLHTAEDIETQYERQRGHCYYCQEKVGDTYHIDHVIPLSRGGSNGPENIVIACPKCNQSKQNRLPSEWPQGGRLL